MALQKLVVEPSQPVALPRRLLDVIGEFPLPAARNGQASADDRWLMQGITWNPLPCRPVLTQAADDPCSPLTSTDPDYGCVAAVSQTAFRVYDAFSGSTIDFEASDLEGMLRRRLPLMASYAFAHELVSGAAGSDLSLANSAHAPAGAAFGSAASPIWDTLAILEAELAINLYGERGTILLPPGLLAQAVNSYGLHLVGDHWETPLGNLVITDAGFVNATQPSGAGASGSAEDWVYAAGQITYRSTDPKLIGDLSNEFLSISTNDMLRWMEMYGILKFDPCPVTAALASYNMVTF